MAYLVLFVALDLYIVVKVWPPAARTTTSPASDTQKPTETNNASSSGGSASNQKQTTTTQQEQDPLNVKFFWADEFSMPFNEALFLIVMACGSLGTLLRSLRSFYWYAGNRELKWSWASMYFLLPFTGAVLAVIFYLIVRSGMTQPVGNGGPFGVAAIGALVGLFSEEAVLKLQQVAETVFTPKLKGKDTAGPAASPPKVTGISQPNGPLAGGTSVTIAGENFVAGAKVNFGGTAATSVVVGGPGSITAKTPAHAAGAVDVEVVNPDGQKATLPNGFTYQEDARTA